jgi:UrcA family protein
MLAFVLLALGTLVSNLTVADPGGTRKVTERGSISLADLDVLTPKGLYLANWRIQQMAQQLCLQIVNMDERDAAACVVKAVADAQQKLDAVIQARLAEREAHAVAFAAKH